MAEDYEEEWVEASPPMDMLLIVYAVLIVPLGLSLLFSFGFNDPDDQPSLVAQGLGACAILGVIPIYRRKRSGTLRWNEDRVQQIGWMKVVSSYNWNDLTEIREAHALQRATTFKFGYGKSLRLITGPGYLPMSDYYKILNVAKRKLKENARTA